MKETIGGFDAMLRRMSKDPPPALDELAEVTLRRPFPLAPRPVGPQFFRRSCTFVAEAGWRKSTKEAKERQNSLLRRSQKNGNVEIGSAGLGEHDGGRGAQRVQRLMGNGLGGARSWSSSEDVRQSVLGAFNKTVSVISQVRRSSKLYKSAIPEMKAVDDVIDGSCDVINNNNNNLTNGNATRRSMISKSSSASQVSTPATRGNMSHRNSVPCLNTGLSNGYTTPVKNDKKKKNNNNNNSNNNTPKNTPNGPTPTTNGITPNGTPRNNNNNNKNKTNNANNKKKNNNKNATNNANDDFLFKKPAPPVGYNNNYNNKNKEKKSKEKVGTGYAAKCAQMPLGPNNNQRR